MRSEGIGAGVTWAADNRTVYYVTVDDAWRPDTVWRYRLGAGTPAEEVYHEPDERFWLAVGRTRSDAYILIAAGSAITSEIRYCDAADPAAEFTTVLPRREGVEYSLDHAVINGEHKFLIVHNNGAVNFTLVEAPVHDLSAQRTLIDHRDDVRIDGVDAFANHFVVSYRREALPRIQVWPIGADGEYGRPAGDFVRFAVDVGGSRREPELGFADDAGGGDVVSDAGAGLRPRTGDRSLDVVARTAGAR